MGTGALALTKNIQTHFEYIILFYSKYMYIYAPQAGWENVKTVLWLPNIPAEIRKWCATILNEGIGRAVTLPLH